MALEIERRFLVRGDAWRGHVLWQADLRQGYLSAGAEGITTRVRCAASEAWLTLKCASADSPSGLVRHEFEYPIPIDDAEALLALSLGSLRKCRFGLDLPGGAWVLDVFEGDNAPLVIVEVELSTPDAPLQLPPWCAEEITGQGRFSNAALASLPLSRWPQQDRRRVLQSLA